VEVVVSEVRNVFPVFIPDGCGPDVPFVWDGPVIALHPGRIFLNFQVNMSLKDVEGFSDSVSGDASAYRKKLFEQLIHVHHFKIPIQ
jgi:hypothetical protein